MQGKRVLRGVREESAVLTANNVELLLGKRAQPEVAHAPIVLDEHDEQLGALVNLRARRAQMCVESSGCGAESVRGRERTWAKYVT